MSKFIKCFKPIDMIPLIISCTLLFISIKYSSYLVGLMSLCFAWQLGWGNKINKEINESNE